MGAQPIPETPEEWRERAAQAHRALGDVPMLPEPRRPADGGDAKRDLLVDLGIIEQDEHYNGDD